MRNVMSMGTGSTSERAQGKWLGDRTQASARARVAQKLSATPEGMSLPRRAHLLMEGNAHTVLGSTKNKLRQVPVPQQQLHTHAASGWEADMTLKKKVLIKNPAWEKAMALYTERERPVVVVQSPPDAAKALVKRLCRELDVLRLSSSGSSCKAGRPISTKEHELVAALCLAIKKLDDFENASIEHSHERSFGDSLQR